MCGHMIYEKIHDHIHERVGVDEQYILVRTGKNSMSKGGYQMRQ